MGETISAGKWQFKVRERKSVFGEELIEVDSGVAPGPAGWAHTTLFVHSEVPPGQRKGHADHVARLEKSEAEGALTPDDAAELAAERARQSRQ